MIGEVIVLDTYPGNPSSFIYRGKEVVPHSIPWQVYLPTVGCGGALISNRHILTAAHCTKGWYNSDLNVIVGQHIKYSSDGKAYTTCKMTIHPDYIEFQHPTIDAIESTNFDFAILHLCEAVQFGSKVKPVYLPEDSSSLAGDFLANKMLTVSGWGRTENKEGSVALRSVETPGISNKRCSEILDPIEPNKIEACHLCAGNLGENFAGACEGDSGGIF